MTGPEFHPLPHEAETDARFPSGPWTGFYVQLGQRGQQAMTLAFRKGEIQGTGVDEAGAFLIEGQYDAATGRCALSKSFEGSHTVEYEGSADKTGIWGTWLLYHDADPLGIPRDHGTFHIWPQGRPAPSAASGATGSTKPVSCESPG